MASSFASDQTESLISQRSAAGSDATARTACARALQQFSCASTSFTSRGERSAGSPTGAAVSFSTSWASMATPGERRSTTSVRRTPCSPPHDDLGLEGVVAKRLDARYAEGRRTTDWLKHKHRRREHFVITGWRERNGALPEFLLARRTKGGDLRPAGSACLGLDAQRRAELLGVLTQHELPARRKYRGVRWTAPLVELVADVHGPADGPVRDAIIREVMTPNAHPVV